jgi:hypothetical protein
LPVVEGSQSPERSAVSIDAAPLTQAGSQSLQLLARVLWLTSQQQRGKGLAAPLVVLTQLSDKCLKNRLRPSFSLLHRGRNAGCHAALETGDQAVLGVEVIQQATLADDPLEFVITIAWNAHADTSRLGHGVKGKSGDAAGADQVLGRIHNPIVGRARCGITLCCHCLSAVECFVSVRLRPLSEAAGQMHHAAGVS